MRSDIREPVLAAKLGCSRQALRNLRLGEKQRCGKYSYEPQVTDGEDWYKDGSVFWTPAGQAKARGLLKIKRKKPG